MSIDDLTIMPMDNGPVIVKGIFQVIDINGKQIVTGGTVALCRCGGSNNKPFCDGSHVSIRFRSVIRAVKEPVAPVRVDRHAG